MYPDVGYSQTDTSHICDGTYIYINTLHPHVGGGYERLCYENMTRISEKNVNMTPKTMVIRLPETGHHGSHQTTPAVWSLCDCIWGYLKCPKIHTILTLELLN